MEAGKQVAKEKKLKSVVRKRVSMTEKGREGRADVAKERGIPPGGEISLWLEPWKRGMPATSREKAGTGPKGVTSLWELSVHCQKKDLSS